MTSRYMKTNRQRDRQTDRQTNRLNEKPTQSADAAQCTRDLSAAS